MENVTIIDDGWSHEIVIYTLEELQSQDAVSGDEVDEWLDSLYISMCVNMWRYCHINDDKTSQELIDLMTTESRFMYDYKWTKEQRSGFEHIFYNILTKVGGFSPEDAWQNITHFSAFGPAFILVDQTYEYYEEYLKLVSDIDNGDDHMTMVGNRDS